MEQIQLLCLLVRVDGGGQRVDRGFDKTDRIQNLWVMSLPNATPEAVGV